MTRKAQSAQPKGRAASTGRAKRNGQRRSTKTPTPTRKLTDQQRAFVIEYITDWNGTQAAIRAGYSEKTASQIAYQLLQKTSVQDYLEEAKKEVLARAGIRTEAILLELAKIGFSSQRHLLQVDQDGNVHLRPGSEIPDSTWDAVKSITAIDNESESESESPNGATRHSRSRQRTVSVVMHDKRAALVDLGRYVGVFGTPGAEAKGAAAPASAAAPSNAIPEEDRAARLAALMTRVRERQEGQHAAP